ncbi:MAG TPA: aminodeoxychorismate/anthranilate synthase component II [Candidatus Omnitrophota bacterium]|mgnify:CR=1 FL=1|nr:aminodeoxychorismate/anthranilate synthase component II [Candidatus Omnitrophota bacterium]HPS20164.1 aminodeoxychorismate/anthranilate synthase component II [Candidatus Omnitrophota bacterium]
MILVIDNYDSFTYNLVQYIGELGKSVKVYRNDKITLDEIKALKPTKIIISPGPGTPSDAGISKSVIAEFGKNIPVLGVCLGHQCIGEVFGCKIVRAKYIMHGKVSDVYHNGSGVFESLPSPFVATRYHSLLIDPATLEKPLEVVAWTEMQEIMGVRHRDYPIWGVQFHPESILTVEGKKLLNNFLTKI